MEKEKSVTIYVNGRELTVEKGKISYEEVVNIAFPNPDYENYIYKVTYFIKKDNHEGALEKGGHPVEVVDGMSFTVASPKRS